jgi:D-alanyl-lipoteichoic acid acyltransferase DltB (MBOAT superfamily)
MLFNSIEFIIFLIVVFGVTWLLARWRMVQTIFLLVASYFFYANWNPWYLFLIFFTSNVDYLVGGTIYRTADQTRRKLLLALSLCTDLGVLAVFKYFNFFASQVSTSINAAGVAVDPVLLSVVLPVGISFFTFQSMSYTIDIYRRQLEPADNYWHFLLFVSFFPQLVAGPIVRASVFLPQLRQPRGLSREQGGIGLFLIMSGLVKKVCIADYLSVNLVDRVFENPQWFTSAEVLAAVYGYAFQIYCDFSGYSDVAIGAALLLGFRLPDNFRSPYGAMNLRDFWRRWHISLSTWLRDYLYFSLGGSHKGPWRTYMALTATMVLGGLWHGAAWTFVIWGALHGVALALTRVFQRLRGPITVRAMVTGALLDMGPRDPAWARIARATSAVVIDTVVRVGMILLTFHFVCFAWIFFRAKSYGDAVVVLEQLGKLSPGSANVVPTVALALFAAWALHCLPEDWVGFLRKTFARLPFVVQALIMVAVSVLVYSVAQSKVVPYIYFQF